MVGLARNFSLIGKAELKLESTVAIAFMFKKSSVLLISLFRVSSCQIC